MLTVDSLQFFLDYILIHPEASGQQTTLVTREHSSNWKAIVNFFFFLDEKETKNQDL
jgi:hypothetical protein